MKLSSRLLLTALVSSLGLGCTAEAKTPDGKPFVLLLGGRPSHAPGEHEHNAGVLLLAKCLAQGAPGVVTKVSLSGAWPTPEELAMADSILLYSDGGGGHIALQENRLADLSREMQRGAGLVCLHYAVEPAYEKQGWPVPEKGPDGKMLKQAIPAERGSKGKGAQEFLDWLGGYFEQYWSVNPHWTANFQELPKHAISSGVRPFSTNDEWYFHMRFRRGMQGVTPILSDVPPPATMNRGEGPHAGNPDVKRAVLEEKTPQLVAWAVERADGGRGFGFTGGHYHKGWANDEQRKLVLNAILWSAKVEVPASGVASQVTAEDLAANLDPKPPRKPAPTPAAPAPAPSTSSGDPLAKPIATTDKVTRGPVTVKADLKGAKELHLVVTDAGDGLQGDWADWIAPTLIKADGSKIPLTSLPWKETRQGWGQTALNRNAGNQALKLKDEKIIDGIGTHAPAMISYDLPEGVVAFESQAAVDDGGFNQNIGASVVFKVYTTRPADAVLKVSPSDGSKGPGVSVGFAAAQAGMEKFKTAEGLEVSLWAAEPMVQNPTNIDIDPRGRVWVAEAVNYRSSFKQWGTLREEGDRISILSDANGDGIAETEKTFWQSKELQAPLGICVLPQEKGTQVIVSAAPNVWLLTDADGDDVAEKAEIIFKVKGNWDHDHQVHAFVFGADGKFYFNFGNESKELQDADGKVLTDLAGNRMTTEGKPYRQGLVFRCDLVNGKPTNLETLGSNFRNNYEVTVDSFGTMWQSDNDDDGNKGVRINYVMEFGNYGYTDEMTGAGWRTKRTNAETEIPLMHWYQNDPGVVPNLLVTGSGSPTGILINEGAALGAKFENQLIHCDAGPRTVRAYPVTKDGAGYQATMVDVLTSEDPWYRPADVAIAPDGSLFVADWYDSGVGGHNMADHNKGQVRGRLYRVAARGAKSQVPAIDLSNAAGAVAALKSPNRATVYAAWQKLAKLGTGAEPELAKVWKDEKNPRLRARALALLAHLPNGLDWLKKGLSDPESDLRVAAVRLTTNLARTGQLDTTPLEEDRELTKKLLRDPSPQVRRQIALALRGAKKIAPIWAALAQQYDGQDRWYLEALGIGATGHEDACFDAWFAAVKGDWNTAAGRDILWRLRSAKTAPYLAKILEDQGVVAAEKPRYLRAFDFLPDAPEKTQVLVELASLGNGTDFVAAEALTRLKNVDVNANAGVKAAIEKQLAASKGTTRLIEIVRDFKLQGRGAELLDAALANLQDPLANEALQLVLAEPDAAQVLDAALSEPQAAKVVTLLGTSSTPRIINRLSKLATRANAPLSSRTAAIQALARSQTGAQAIIQLAKNNELPADLQSAATAALNLVQYPALKADLAALFPPPAALGGQPLAAISELVKIKGDLARGKMIAERAESSCVLCHRVGDKGVDFGPGLTEIGSKLPKEALYESIINPNAGVSMGFETTQIQAKDGTVAIGIVRSETNDEVVLALPGGAANKFSKRDIAKREKLPTSLMPSGLNQALSQQDLVDLVEYLVSLKKP